MHAYSVSLLIIRWRWLFRWRHHQCSSKRRRRTSISSWRGALVHRVKCHRIACHLHGCST